MTICVTSRLLRRTQLNHHALLTRPFSASAIFNLRTNELQESHFKSLRADASRLWSDIHSTAQFGTGKRYGDGPEQTGLSRLALSQADKQARDWFVKTTKDLGCDMQIDKIGNVFAVRKGLRNDVPPTFAGSHLDSQPNGGRFDGVLGVCAGVEMLRILDENWIETEGPVGVVNWTNEEGARWRKSMMGSGVWAGVNSLKEIYGLKDKDGVSVEEALRSIGYKGDVGLGQDEVKMAGHFELHIEQGKTLERQQKQVAVVDGVQAYKWFTITVEGREGHAGATALEDRADAMEYCAKMIGGFYKLAKHHQGLVTIGTINIEQGSVNTVPGKVTITLDVRHRDDAELEKLIVQLENAGRAALDTHSVNFRVTWQEDFASKAVTFNETAMRCVRDSAKNVLDANEGKVVDLSINHEVPSMTSGAGHDSVNTNLHCPTAMIFVPCKDGVTHNPEEWCNTEDARVGTDVLIQSVLRFDRQQNGQSSHIG